MAAVATEHTETHHANEPGSSDGALVESSAPDGRRTEKANAGSNLQVEGFFDPGTWTVSYIVFDKKTRRCALVDSVLDYDPKSGRTSNASADKLIARVLELDAKVQWILETHVHADHLSAAPYLKEEVGGRLGIGQHITVVQTAFGNLFNVGPEFVRDGRQFDHLFADGESVRDRQPTRTCDAHPGPHAGLHDVRGERWRGGKLGQRRVGWRHALHAGLRHRTLRLPRR